MSQRLGNYEILAKIGQGGMGTVYRARQVTMDREVALKVLPKRLAADATFVARFQREAKAAGRLNHPHLVAAHECGQEGAYHFLAMEFVPGGSLKPHIGRIPERRAVALMRQVASALQAAHEAGIIHRDVKPDNILLTAKGDAKLADLGLAKPIDGESDVTLAGKSIGTPLYMSPEQAKAEDCDGRADLYALAATFFHLVAGEPLFSGTTPSAVSVKHCTETPRHLWSLQPSVSAAFDHILFRCLAKKPADRYADAGALIRDLDHLTAGKPIGPAGRRARRGQIAEESAPRRRRASPLPVIIGSAVVLVAIAGAGAMALSRGGAPSPAPPASAPEPVVAAPTATARPASTSALSGPEPQPAPLAATGSRPGEDILDHARAHFADHPEDFAKVTDWLRQAAVAGVGTVVAIQAEEERARVEAAWDEWAEAHFATATEPIREHVDQGDFDAARAASLSLDGAWRERVARKLVALAAEIDNRASAVLEGHLAAAEKALAGTDPDAAEAALAAFDATRASPGRARLAEQRTVLGEMVGQARIAARTAQGAAFTRVAGELLDGLIAGETVAVSAQVETLSQDDAFLAVTDDLAAVGRVATSLDQRQAAVQAHVAAMVGQHLEVAKVGNPVSGTVLAVDDAGIQLEVVLEMDGTVVGRSKPRIAWSQIDPRQLDDWLATWQPESADDWLARAILALAEDDADGCDQALNQAEGHALAGVVGQRLRALRLGAAEIAAEQAFASQIALLLNQRDLDPERGAAVVAAVDTWRQAHGECAIARMHQAELDALRRRGEVAQMENLLVDGGFELGSETFGRNWRHGGFGGGILRPDPSAARSGSAGLLFQRGSGDLHLGILPAGLQAELEPGAIYELAFACRLASAMAAHVTVDWARVPSQSYPLTETWADHRFRFRWTAEVTRPGRPLGGFRAMVDNQGGNEGLTVHFDDIVLSQVAPAVTTGGDGQPLRVIGRWFLSLEGRRIRACEFLEGGAITGNNDFEQARWTLAAGRLTITGINGAYKGFNTEYWWDSETSSWVNGRGWALRSE